MSDKTIQITEKGYKALKIELSSLVETKRPAMVKRLSNARAEGDLKENSDYQNAKDELAMLDGKIDELKHVLKVAKVITITKGSGVSVGTMVTVAINGSENSFEIVGEWEADPMKRKISHKSPLGQALVGKKVGDKVEVEAPAGQITYTIKKIE